MNDVVLAVKGLTARRGSRTILDNVSFDVRRDEILGVIGPNGAGKTTLFECIAGLQPRDAGQIDAREQLFYVPDAIRPWPDQTVAWTLRTCAAAFDSKAVDLDLAPLANQRVSSLSKGETKRLNIAIGLATPHPILFLDEPFDGLDLKQTRSVMNVLRGVTRTLVLSIHQLKDAARICDRLLLLNQGRVIATVEPDADLEEMFLALT